MFTGGSKLVKSNLPRSKFPFILGGVPRFLSTYIHTHYRLDKLRSTLVEAQLKSAIKMNISWEANVFGQVRSHPIY